MNEPQKSYGEIAFGSAGNSQPLELCHGSVQIEYDKMARSVISAFKERELESGWRLLEEGEQPEDGDQAYYSENGWVGLVDASGIVPYRKGLAPMRRPCKFLKSQGTYKDYDLHDNLVAQGNVEDLKCGAKHDTAFCDLPYQHKGDHVGRDRGWSGGNVRWTNQSQPQDDVFSCPYCRGRITVQGLGHEQWCSARGEFSYGWKIQPKEGVTNAGHKSSPDLAAKGPIPDAATPPDPHAPQMSHLPTVPQAVMTDGYTRGLNAAIEKVREWMDSDNMPMLLADLKSLRDSQEQALKYDDDLESIIKDGPPHLPSWKELCNALRQQVAELTAKCELKDTAIAMAILTRDRLEKEIADLKSSQLTDPAEEAFEQWWNNNTADVTGCHKAAARAAWNAALNTELRHGNPLPPASGSHS